MARSQLGLLLFLRGYRDRLVTQARAYMQKGVGFGSEIRSTALRKLLTGSTIAS